MRRFIINFLHPQEIPTLRDAFEVSFPYILVDEKYINTPEEKSQTKNYNIKVGISGRMDAAWRAQDKGFNLLAILYEFGKRHIIQKLKDHTLQKDEELIISSATHPNNCPFNSAKIKVKYNEPIIVEIPNEPILEVPEFNKLADFIIGSRDNINTLFHSLYKDKLLFINQERDLLQLFKDAQTLEEFIFRITALRNIVTSINTKALVKILNDSQNENQSINLFEQYLKFEFTSSYNDNIIKTYRHINRLRMSYPIHSDQIDGIFDALKHFGLIYPIDDHSLAWKTILNQYKISLVILLDLFKKRIF